MVVFTHIEDDIELLLEYVRSGRQKRLKAAEASKDVDPVELQEKVQLLEKLQTIFTNCAHTPVLVIDE